MNPAGTRGRPRLTLEAAEALALREWGVRGSARALPSDRDQNFELRGDGLHMVLKVARAGEDLALLECQNEALALLRERVGHRTFPAVHPARSGGGIVLVEDDDGRHFAARLLDWVPGVPLARARPRSPELLEDVGRLVGAVDAALTDFDPPPARRDLQWDLRQGPAVVEEHSAGLASEGRRGLVARTMETVAETWPRLMDLPSGLIHGDPNDWNVLVSRARPAEERQAVSLLDLGDLVHSWRVADAAIAAAYAMFGSRDPLHAALAVIRGYHAERSLSEHEVEAVWPLALLRLCTSVCLSARQRASEPENEYLSISEVAAWALLERLDSRVHPRLARYALRSACGLPPCPDTRFIEGWLREHAEDVGPLLETAGGEHDELIALDLSVGSTEVGDLPGRGDPAAWTRWVEARLRQAQASLGLGRWGEPRAWYRSPAFAVEGDDRTIWRTVHLGVDLFAAAGTPVLAPLAGLVYGVRDNAGPMDYGPTVILEHRVRTGAPPDGASRDVPDPPGVPPVDDRDVLRFWTLYGHLSRDSLAALAPGQLVARGERIGTIGRAEENGGWAPHLHLQIIADLLGREDEFPGVARPDERAVWAGISPDPGPLLLGLPSTRPPDAPGVADLLEGRRQRIGPSLSASYRRPLHIVRGWMRHLYDSAGQPYLDAVNNVAHVGHEHPRVTDAIVRQSRVLNTNTRYLHELLGRYGDALVSTLPAPLEVCYLVSSGSEANELALRMARACTGRRDVVVLEGAYHGNTSTMIDMSPYKYRGHGGTGKASWVHEAALPCPYRGRHAGFGGDAAGRYADDVERACRDAAANGDGPAAFFAEALPGCAGQIVPPVGFLAEAFARARAAGAICVADEVQTGLGRVGEAWWAFELDGGAVPDIVTAGKPLGNGHPLAAVITTRAIADTFDNGMEYFNTFGGNPVSCAAGLAVLDVLETEGLRANAAHVGGRLLEDLARLEASHELVGHVRGRGLYLGVELVSDRERRTPSGDAAAHVVERMRERGILLSTDGVDHNVLKIKPPLPFTLEDARFLVEVLDDVLAEDALAGPVPGRNA